MNCSDQCTKNCPYSDAGKEFYKRIGYCPFADTYFDPEKQEEYLNSKLPLGKRRVGQQKQHRKR